MRKRRLIAVLGALALLVGLAVVTPEQASATVAAPLTGYNQTTLKCYNGTSWLSLDVTWYVNLVSAESGGTPALYYIQAKKITYHGPTLNGPAPAIYLKVAGTASTTTNLGSTSTWGSPINAPVTDGATRTDGVGGYSSPVDSVYYAHTDTVARTIQVAMTKNSSSPWGDCTSPVFPINTRGRLDSGIVVGQSQSGTLQCMSPGLPGATGDYTDKLGITYDVAQTGVDTYTVKVINALYVAGPGLTYGPDAGIALDVDANASFSPGNPVTGIAPYQLPSADQNFWSGPTPSFFLESDGTGGPPATLFPTVAFTTTGGTDPIAINAEFKHDNYISACKAHWYLTTAFSPTNYGPIYDRTLFDDCSGTAAQIVVTPIWQFDYNKKRSRLTSLSIWQDGIGKLVLDAGTATTRGGFTYVGGGVDVFGISSGTTLANRTIDSHETQVIDVDAPAKWVRMDGLSDSANPSTPLTADPGSVYFTISAHDILPGGAECTFVPPARDPWPAGVSGSTTELEFSPHLP